jgi:hypothetical protein
MKKEAQVLLNKSIDSLVLSIDHFNRAWDRGRPEVVLVLLDRAFELLLKAVIVHKGGKIREPRSKETIGFDKCVRKCLSDTDVKCLSEDEALTIQIINSLRDAAQHYILDISEQQLYLFTKAGVSQFTEIVKDAFGISLFEQLPHRVLPVSTSPPQSLTAIMEAEFSEIKKLVQPGSRKRLEARARIRPLAIVDSSLAGVRSQPGEWELGRLLSELSKGKDWFDIFPRMSQLELETDESGLAISIHFSRSKGEPVHLVPEGTPGATIVALRKVDALSFYSLGLHKLAEKLGLTWPKTLALVRYLEIQDDNDCFKVFRIGSSSFKRYSPKALDRLKKALETVDMDEVWQQYGIKRKKLI